MKNTPLNVKTRQLSLEFSSHKVPTDMSSNLLAPYKPSRICRIKPTNSGLLQVVSTSLKLQTRPIE
jgi:hypothetical protein